MTTDRPIKDIKLYDEKGNLIPLPMPISFEVTEQGEPSVVIPRESWDVVKQYLDIVEPKPKSVGYKCGIDSDGQYSTNYPIWGDK